MTGFHDVFSKRGKQPPDVFSYEALPDRFRIQVIHILRPFVWRCDWEVLGHIIDIVCEEHGVLSIDRKGDRRRRNTNIPEEMEICVTSHEDCFVVLDLIELLMRALPTIQIRDDFGYEEFGEEAALDVYKKLNHRFREHGLGYEYNADAGQIIKVSSTLLHDSATIPSLVLLSRKEFASANSEFLEAYEDYKIGDFSDCVVKACSAFESVLKVVCERKGWPFDPDKDTCGKLVGVVMKHGDLDSFLAEPLKLIGTIRNKKSSAHGGGTVVRDVSEALARYCLNATASSILYIVEATE